MSDTAIIMAVIAFILGSIQYQLRIKWQDAKDNILIAVRPYFGYAERGFMTLYAAIDEMNKYIKQNNVDEGTKKEFKKCLDEYNSAKFWLRFWGIIFPTIALFTYFIMNRI